MYDKVDEMQPKGMRFFKIEKLIEKKTHDMFRLPELPQVTSEYFLKLSKFKKTKTIVLNEEK